jgi:RNA polymerase sigma factor (sigma-70 family)
VHDEQLFAAWRGGDQVAGNELARRYYSALHSFFRTRVPSQEVEELTQLVLLHTIAQPQRFRGASSLSHYIHMVARRMLADRFRQFWRNREDPWPEDDHSALLTPPSQILVRREWAARLREVLDQIPARYAEVLRLHLAGVENHEIAAQLDVNYNTVRSRLSRAIDCVRERLGPEAMVSPRSSKIDYADLLGPELDSSPPP